MTNETPTPRAAVVAPERQHQPEAADGSEPFHQRSLASRDALREELQSQIAAKRALKAEFDAVRAERDALRAQAISAPLQPPTSSSSDPAGSGSASAGDRDTEAGESNESQVISRWERLKRLQTLLAEWADGLRHARSNLREESQRLSAARLEVDGMAIKLAHKDGSLRRTEMELRAKESELDNYSEILDKKARGLEGEADRLEADRIGLTAKRQKMEAMVAQAEAVAAATAAELRAVKQEARRLRKSLDDAHGQIDDLQRREERLNRSLQKVRSQLKEQSLADATRVVLHFRSAELLGDLLAVRGPSLLTTAGLEVVTCGTGPMACELLDEALERTHVVPQLLDAQAHQFQTFVVGRGDVDVELLAEQIELRLEQGLEVKVYSQELWVLSMLVGQDCLDTDLVGLPILKSEFAEDHPVLQLFLGDVWQWPTWPDPGPGRTDDDWLRDMAKHSPLSAFGYHTGRRYDDDGHRQTKLREFFELGDITAFLDVSRRDREHVRRWGQARSSRRLEAMARHIHWLAAGQGQAAGKELAQRHWLEDLRWMKRQLLRLVERPFTWPG